MLDPGYLAGDFGIELRHYHHRFFTYLIAVGSAAFGEDHDNWSAPAFRAFSRELLFGK